MDDAIRAGLVAAQASLPSRLLYDDLGSTLFEAITMLPEYGVARADLAILADSIDAALASLPGALEVVELGPGHGLKARLILERLSRRQDATHFIGIDVSAAALRGCTRRLEEVPGLSVTTIEASYFDGLAALPARRGDHRRLVLFLGSNLSNVDRAAARDFLAEVRRHLDRGDAVLLSADLDKEPYRLLSAYDDALGVTAAFNRNLLVRLRREWHAEVDIGAFRHVARWNPVARRIEMHLRATRPTRLSIPRLAVERDFEAGQTLWTESSHRFEVAELTAWGRAADLACAEVWVDRDWPLALALFVATATTSPWRSAVTAATAGRRRAG
jgi:L-histidine N-alpha-methyltransferase